MTYETEVEICNELDRGQCVAIEHVRPNKARDSYLRPQRR